MHHVGHDIDAGYKAATKPEPARDGVVMHLVFGQFGGVVGLDAIGFEPVRHRLVPLDLSVAMVRQDNALARAPFPRFSSHFPTQWVTTRLSNSYLQVAIYLSIDDRPFEPHANLYRRRCLPGEGGDL